MKSLITRTTTALCLIVVLLAAACQQTVKEEQADAGEADTAQSLEPPASEQTPSVETVAQSSVSDDLRLLGWTNDGKVLAYRSFFLSDAISRHSTIKVEVVDIVSDKVLWDFKKDWDEGNSGEEGAETSPVSGDEAWKIVGEEVGYEIAKFNIVPGEEPESHESFGTFPFGGDIDAFSAEATELQADNSYKVIASSAAQGTKTLIERQSDPGSLTEAQVVGYFMNPQSNRIAIIVKEIPMNPVVYFYVTGCALNTGFKK